MLSVNGFKVSVYFVVILILVFAVSSFCLLTCLFSVIISSVSHSGLLFMGTVFLSIGAHLS